MKMWYESQKSGNHILVAARVRLARNLVDYPFSMKITKEQSRALTDEVREKFFRQCCQEDNFYRYYDLESTDSRMKNAMAERYTMTPLLRDKKLPAGLIVSEDESRCIMIGEEDHLRIQAASMGDAMDAAYQTACQLDDEMGGHVEYAYNHKYGYITACPTSMGTGLRAAYIMHLPFLEKENLIKPLADELNRLGFIMRNMYGDASGALGSLYQLSNQRTLGMSEEDILISLKNMMVQVTDQERRSRERLLRKRRPEIEDIIYRSYGVLKYGKMFGAGEALNHLSNIRMGFDEGILHGSDSAGDIFAIMMNVLPGTLMCSKGKNFGSADRHLCRAGYIHTSLPDIDDAYSHQAPD